ncbi:LOW QUALITY PROTEIN: hypothetical protein QTO34_016866, partial [Cnephaeus nilssonii]
MRLKRKSRPQLGDPRQAENAVTKRSFRVNGLPPLLSSCCSACASGPTLQFPTVDWSTQLPLKAGRQPPLLRPLRGWEPPLSGPKAGCKTVGDAQRVSQCNKVGIAACGKARVVGPGFPELSDLSCFSPLTIPGLLQEVFQEEVPLGEDNEFSALFTLPKIWKQPKCPSANEWMIKLWDIYTMDYHSVVKKEKISPFGPGKHYVIRQQQFSSGHPPIRAPPASTIGHPERNSDREALRSGGWPEENCCWRKTGAGNHAIGHPEFRHQRLPQRRPKQRWPFKPAGGAGGGDSRVPTPRSYHQPIGHPESRPSRLQPAQ